MLKIEDILCFGARVVIFQNPMTFFAAFTFFVTIVGFTWMLVAGLREKSPIRKRED